MVRIRSRLLLGAGAFALVSGSAAQTPPGGDGFASAAPPAAVAPALPRTEIETGLMPQWLTNGRGTWREYYVDGLHRYGERNVLYGTLRETRRFGENDSQGVIGAYHALTPQLTAVVEVSGSPTHNVLPKWVTAGQLGYNFTNGWGVYAGARHTDYPTTFVNMATLMVEKYFGAFRAAYTLNENWLAGSGGAAMHVGTLNYYYSDRSQTTLSVANGRTVENVGSPQGVVSSNLTSVSVSGRHWFSREFALSYEVTYQNQPRFYAQTGVRIGLRYGF